MEKDNSKQWTIGNKVLDHSGYYDRVSGMPKAPERVDPDEYRNEFDKYRKG